MKTYKVKFRIAGSPVLQQTTVTAYHSHAAIDLVKAQYNGAYIVSIVRV